MKTLFGSLFLLLMPGLVWAQPTFTRYYGPQSQGGRPAAKNGKPACFGSGYRQDMQRQLGEINGKLSALESRPAPQPLPQMLAAPPAAHDDSAILLGISQILQNQQTIIGLLTQKPCPPPATGPPAELQRPAPQSPGMVFVPPAPAGPAVIYSPPSGGPHVISPPQYVPPSGPPQYVPPSGPPQYVPPSTPPQYVPPSTPPQYVPPSTPPSYVPPSTQPQYVPPSGGSPQYTPPAGGGSGTPQYTPPSSPPKATPYMPPAGEPQFVPGGSKAAPKSTGYQRVEPAKWRPVSYR